MTLNEEEQFEVGNLADSAEAWEVVQNELSQHQLLHLLHGAAEEEASVVTLETEEEIEGAVDSTAGASEEVEEGFVEVLVIVVEGEVLVTEVGSVTVAEVEADTETETAAAAVSEEVTVASGETMAIVAEGASGKLCLYISFS